MAIFRTTRQIKGNIQNKTRKEKKIERKVSTFYKYLDQKNIFETRVPIWEIFHFQNVKIENDLIFIQATLGKIKRLILLSSDFIRISFIFLEVQKNNSKVNYKLCREKQKGYISNKLLVARKTRLYE